MIGTFFIHTTGTSFNFQLHHGTLVEVEALVKAILSLDGEVKDLEVHWGPAATLSVDAVVAGVAIEGWVGITF